MIITFVTVASIIIRRSSNVSCVQWSNYRHSKLSKSSQKTKPELEPSFGFDVCMYETYEKNEAAQLSNTSRLLFSDL